MDVLNDDKTIKDMWNFFALIGLKYLMNDIKDMGREKAYEKFWKGATIEPQKIHLL